MTTEARHLGTLLLQDELITSAELDRAIQLQQETDRPLGRILVDEGLVEEADLVRTLARRIGLEYVNLGEVAIDPSAGALVPEALARRYAALPIAFEDGKLVVAMADPANVLAIDDIRAVTGMELVAKVATRSDVDDAIGRIARMDDSVSELAQLAAEDHIDVSDLAAMEAAVEEAPVVKLVKMLITRAVTEGASDIHVEPGERDLQVRFRIDGVLHEITRSSRSITNAVVSRLKIMADINIAERRVPQDGRVSLRVAGRQIDLRVATLPTVFGEKVVMRILDKSSTLLDLAELGFLPDSMERYEKGYRKPYGTILVTGPTGSGKSTTLYATLNVLNRPEVNIITVEDPVEYRLAGINQVQVNRKAGLSFASALRSILRSDPDIILIGEIRDHETAQIAIESALTGHLVLSTLHTNDAPSSIGRLIEMGVEPFLVSSALDAVLAQRLARRLCGKCKQPYQPSLEALMEVGWPLELVDELPTLYRAVGCKACSGTGYRGRLAIHEVMLVTEEIERLAVERRSSDELRKVAISQGMRTLREDGLAKVHAGATSIEEVLRVVV
ncbi:MAG: Flp pilus assembly complex ATPase component TadA [Actinomycetota bacterium]|nr:Flp pilus assembly complex ATPase component TadA [Actinomycetota bacterium]